MVPDRLFIAAILVALGLTASGFFVGRGFVRARTTERYVTVKGVAEREVKADLALWPLQLVSTHDELGQAQSEIDRWTGQILAFLDEHGVDRSQTQVQGLEVTDRRANRFGETDTSGARFVVQQTLMVRSNDPDAVNAASQEMGELVQAGIVLSSGQGFGPARPTFLFTRLNDIKPPMIAEATAAAREAAEQFAADSQSRISGIRLANQGVFVILPRDQAPGIQEGDQLMKTVRIVTTIDYYIEG